MAKKPKIVQSSPEPVRNELDPHLQEIVLLIKEGKKVDPSFGQAAADGTLEIDILAELQDPKKTVQGLKITTTIGNIVTGVVAAEDIEKVRDDPNVISLKRGAKIRPALAYSVPEIRASAAVLHEEFPDRTTPYDGSGVLVGVVDYGCDFAHRNFRNADGTTRILYLWDQTGGQNSLSPQPYNYGREFSRTKINAALDTDDAYADLQYTPEDAEHGTHVLDIAAGNGRGTGRSGVAPGAEILFVQMPLDPQSDVDDLENEDERVFGNSKKLVDAIDYLFRKAQELGKQMVVNFSLGTHGGPHDGSTLTERAFDHLLQTPGRAITIAAGNSWGHRSHARGEVSKTAPIELDWIAPASDPTLNELEVWYSGSQELSVQLISPDGEAGDPVALGTSVSLIISGKSFGRMIHRKNDSANHDNHIDILIDPKPDISPLPVLTGTWKVRLSTTETTPVPFHAWIERDDAKFPLTQSRFAANQEDHSHTVGSIACGELPIVVGSYLSGDPQHPISGFSSEGPTRTSRQKPEISAPGQWFNPSDQYGVLAARSSTQGATRKSGTSMAAPHVAGVIALLMQGAARTLTIAEIRQALIDTARKSPPAGTGWDPRFGFGRVDAAAALQRVVPELTPMPLPEAFEPVPAETNGKHAIMPGDMDLISTLMQKAKLSHTRVRLQIEIEPILD